MVGVTERHQKRDDELLRKKIMKENSKELDSIMHMICYNINSRRLST